MKMKWIAILVILISLFAAGCVSDDKDKIPSTEDGKNGSAQPEMPPVTNGTPVEKPSAEQPVVNETITDEKNDGLVVVPSTEAQTYTVNLEKYLALPKELTINKGDTVTWFNRNDPVRVFVLVSNDKLWENQSIGYRGRYIHTFNESGTYTYHVQGFEERMKGVINVK